jgi:hypothetical protein
MADIASIPIDFAADMVAYWKDEDQIKKDIAAREKQKK